MPTAKEKANLARIRANQRRSRARRKEYLQELESRVRLYELQGTKASSELQVAARHVADENRKLRALLSQLGIGNDIVKDFLTKDVMTNIVGYASTETGQPVQVLETLLSTKKFLGTEGESMTPASTASGTSSVFYDRNMHTIQSSPTTLSLASNGIPILSREPQSQHFHLQSQHRHQHQHQQHLIQPPCSFGELLRSSDSQYELQAQERNVQLQQPKQYEYPPTSSDTNSCSRTTDTIPIMAGRNEEDARDKLGCQP